MANVAPLKNMGSDGRVQGLGTGADKDHLRNLKKIQEETKLKPIEDKVTIQKETIQAYYTLENDLLNFYKVVRALRNEPEILYGRVPSVFEARQAMLTINSQESPENYISVKADAGAPMRNYEITISQLARKKVDRSIAFASDTADITEAAGGVDITKFSEGTFDITSNGVTTTISISQGYTLRDIEKAIDDKRHVSFVSANVLKVAANQYRLILQSTKPGTSYDFSITDAGSVLPDSLFTTTQAAQDAAFKLNDIDITREENVISDLIDKTTITLHKVTGVGITLTLDIQPSPEAAKKAIVEFRDAYNTYKMQSSIHHETATSDDPSNNIYKGMPTERARLGREMTFRLIDMEIASKITHFVPGIADGKLSNLHDIGFEFYDQPAGIVIADPKDPNKSITLPQINNLLKLDQEKLDAVLKDTFDEVKQLFGFDAIQDNSDLHFYTRNMPLTFDSVKVTVDDSYQYGFQANATIPHNGTDVYLMDFNNKSRTLTGRVDTPLQGYEFMLRPLVNATTTSFTSIIQGYADWFGARLFGWTDERDNSFIYDGKTEVVGKMGTIPNEIFSKQKAIEDLNKELEEKKQQIEEESARTEQKYRLADQDAFARMRDNQVIDLLNKKNDDN